MGIGIDVYGNRFLNCGRQLLVEMPGKLGNPSIPVIILTIADEYIVLARHSSSNNSLDLGAFRDFSGWPA